MDRKELVQKIAQAASKPCRQEPLFRWRRVKMVIDDELSDKDWALLRSLSWPGQYRRIIEVYFEDDNDLARGRMSEAQYIAINAKLRRLNRPYRLRFDRKYPILIPFKERLVNICRVSLK